MTVLKKPFDLSEARLCAILSDLAYLDPATKIFREGIEESGLSLVGSFSEKTGEGSASRILKVDTQAFCADSATARHIVFRGSEAGFWDWVTDFRIDTDKVDDHEIHQGFFHALSVNGVKSGLDGWINGAGSRRIVFAGHSLGGALAALSAVMRKIPAAKCYTFGQPRIGKISGTFDGTICRFVNRTDIVPRVPVDFSKAIADHLGGGSLGSLIDAVSSKILDKLIVDLDYTHVGSCYFISSDGSFIENGEKAYLEVLADPIGELIKIILDDRSKLGTFDYQGNLITDHGRLNYIAAFPAK
jgi:hypothetical protein